MENQTSDESPKPKIRLKKLIILIILLLLIVGGAGGGVYYWRFAGGSAKAEANGKKPSKSKSKRSDAPETEEVPNESEGTEHASSAPDEEDVKQVIELPPFIINLADTEQARYLRMTVSLGIGGDEGESEKPDPVFSTKVRNAILGVLTTKKSDEILSPTGKSELRKEILKAAQEASTEPHVGAIYITEFIVQL